MFAAWLSEKCFSICSNGLYTALAVKDVLASWYLHWTAVSDVGVYLL